MEYETFPFIRISISENRGGGIHKVLFPDP